MTNYVTDGLKSLLGSLGDPMRDKMAGVSYGVPILTDDQLINAYRGSWLCRKVIDIPAKDSVRAWRSWNAKPDQVARIENEEKRLGLRIKFLEAKIKGRLMGGAAIFIGTGETDLSKPLEPRQIGVGGIKYLSVISRIECSAGDVENDPISPLFGRPKFYRIGQDMREIHASRFARFIGMPFPEARYSFINASHGWGDSALLPVYGALQAVEAGGTNAANMLFEANVDVFGMPDLAERVSNPTSEQALLNRMSLAAVNKSINRSILMDASETFDRKAMSFGGVPDVLEKLMLIAAGAADIPVTRLMGMSPAGLSSTGESDMRNYYDRVNVEQELETTPATSILDECLVRSALGDYPSDVYYSWSPLWQMSTKEKADTAKVFVDAANVMVTAGLADNVGMSKVLGNQLADFGAFPGIENVQAVEPVETVDLTEDPAVTVADAAPRTLYVSRKVKNAEEILDWARSQGFDNLMPADELHVTVVYSRQPVDWIKVGQSWTEELTVAAGGPRLVEVFGTNSLVLQFVSDDLSWRHERAISAGASHDWDEYNPHITFAEFSGLPPALRGIVAYNGRIELGPEIFEELR